MSYRLLQLGDGSEFVGRCFLTTRSLQASYRRSVCFRVRVARRSAGRQTNLSFARRPQIVYRVFLSLQSTPVRTLGFCLDCNTICVGSLCLRRGAPERIALESVTATESRARSCRRCVSDSATDLNLRREIFSSRADTRWKFFERGIMGFLTIIVAIK